MTITPLAPAAPANAARTAPSAARVRTTAGAGLHRGETTRASDERGGRPAADLSGRSHNAGSVRG